MTEDERAELDEVGAIALSHSALLTALFGVLQERKLLTAEDINNVFDTAMTGLENAVAHGGSPRVINRARRVLENTTRNLADRPRRDR